MRTNIYILALMILLGLGVFSSCTEDEVVPSGDKDMSVKLTLQLGRTTKNGTRATDTGIDELNENVIKSVDLFLYKSGGIDAGEQPLFVEKSIQVSKYDPVTYTAELTVALPLSSFKALFPNDADTRCDAYVIANRPTSTSGDNALPAEDMSVASIKENTVLYTDGFQKRMEDNIDGTYSPVIQECFVMEGWAPIVRSDLSLSGTVKVERVASKISLVIKGVADEVTDDYGVVWCSDKSSMRLSLRRGSNRTKLGTTPTEYIYKADSNRDIFNLNAVSIDYETGDGGLTTRVPFYTYPTNWEHDENSRTHFMLVVEWTKKENPSERMITYYEANVNAAGTYIKRNTYYRIYQEIRVLGSPEEESPLVLVPSSYVILDWGMKRDYTDADADTDTDADINNLRYLVVDETDITLHNRENYEIPFFSSHPVRISDIVVKWDDTSNTIAEAKTIASVASPSFTVDENGDIIYVVNSSNDSKNRLGTRPLRLRVHNVESSDGEDRSYIYVEHALLNDMSANADYTQYTISFNVHHDGDTRYSDDVKVVQNPMILVAAELNSNYVDSPSNYNSNKGYVYVNSGGTMFGSADGISSNAGNKNPNRYIISVTSLNTDDYIIGDPRTVSVNNLTWGSGATLASNKPTMKYSGDTNNRSLKYYHPTEDGGRTERMISPRFMIASSYGVTSNVSKVNAERRCATYQEDGYPAGRWRVPTQAEVEYLVGLSAKGVIPILFGYVSGSSSYGQDAEYWSASNAVVVNSRDGSVEVPAAGQVTSASVRCVYDVWYWQDKCNRSTYTFGDKAGGM